MRPVMEAKCARALEMREVHNMSDEAIAKALGLKLAATARSYVSYGRRPGAYQRSREQRERRCGVRPYAEYQATLATKSWTKAKVATLKKLWPTHTAEQIAKLIPTTRDAVIGKAHRLGLEPKRKGRR